MTTILAIGNVADGHRFVGPFPNADEAIFYAELRAATDDWHVIELAPPDDYSTLKENDP